MLTVRNNRGDVSTAVATVHVVKPTPAAGDVTWAGGAENQASFSIERCPPGDANWDGATNILDLIFIRNRLGQNVGTGHNWQTDMTGDGSINIPGRDLRAQQGQRHLPVASQTERCRWIVLESWAGIWSNSGSERCACSSVG